MKQRLPQLVAAAISLVSSGVYSTEPLPRIFFSAAERPALVAMRSRQAITGSGQFMTQLTPDFATSAVRAGARLDGISIATAGDSFAWINGRRFADGARLGPYRIKILRDGLRLTDAAGAIHALQVGESLRNLHVLEEPRS
jgi:hypothetical protein